MRSRERIIGNLEAAYREAFERAREGVDEDRMHDLDFRFQRDQVFLEAILDVRTLLAQSLEEPDDDEDSPSLLEKAQALRRFTKLR